MGKRSERWLQAKQSQFLRMMQEGWRVEDALVEVGRTWRALRKAVRGRGDLCAVVATTREDILPALDPDIVVRCDFGVFEVIESG